MGLVGETREKENTNKT